MTAQTATTPAKALLLEVANHYRREPARRRG